MSVARNANYLWTNQPAPMSLINVKREGGVAIVELLIQRLDASMAVPFKSAVVGLVNGGERKIVLDLGVVEFVDSSGLGARVSILKTLGEKGNDVGLLGQGQCPEPVQTDANGPGVHDPARYVAGRGEARAMRERRNESRTDACDQCSDTRSDVLHLQRSPAPDAVRQQRRGELSSHRLRIDK